MYYGFSTLELIVFIISISLFIVVFIALIDTDYINYLILKNYKSNKYDSFLSNKEAWIAGFKVFKYLIGIGFIVFLFIVTEDTITEGQWFKNFFRYIFLIILIGLGILIIVQIFDKLKDK